MFIILAFVVGVIVGIVAAITVSHLHAAGVLVLDFTHPMSDEPFLLELHKNVNDIYRKKWICLRISQK